MTQSFNISSGVSATSGLELTPMFQGGVRSSTLDEVFAIDRDDASRMIPLQLSLGTIFLNPGETRVIDRSPTWGTEDFISTLVSMSPANLDGTLDLLEKLIATGHLFRGLGLRTGTRVFPRTISRQMIADFVFTKTVGQRGDALTDVVTGIMAALELVTEGMPTSALDAPTPFVPSASDLAERARQYRLLELLRDTETVGKVADALRPVKAGGYYNYAELQDRFEIAVYGLRDAVARASRGATYVQVILAAVREVSLASVRPDAPEAFFTNSLVQQRLRADFTWVRAALMMTGADGSDPITRAIEFHTVLPEATDFVQRWLDKDARVAQIPLLDIENALTVMPTFHRHTSAMLGGVIHLQLKDIPLTPSVFLGGSEGRRGGQFIIPSREFGGRNEVLPLQRYDVGLSALTLDMTAQLLADTLSQQSGKTLVIEITPDPLLLEMAAVSMSKALHLIYDDRTMVGDPQFVFTMRDEAMTRFHDDLKAVYSSVDDVTGRAPTETALRILSVGGSNGSNAYIRDYRAALLVMGERQAQRQFAHGVGEISLSRISNRVTAGIERHMTSLSASITASVSIPDLSPEPITDEITFKHYYALNTSALVIVQPFTRFLAGQFIEVLNTLLDLIDEDDTDPVDLETGQDSQTPAGRRTLLDERQKIIARARVTNLLASMLDRLIGEPSTSVVRYATQMKIHRLIVNGSIDGTRLSPYAHRDLAVFYALGQLMLTLVVNYGVDPKSLNQLQRFLQQNGTRALIDTTAVPSALLGR